MNTSDGPKSLRPEDLFGGREPTPKDEAIQRLEAECAQLRERLVEERFCWVLLSIIAIDLHVFTRSATWAAPIVVGALELLLLLVLARRFGVQEIIRFVDKALDSWGKKTGSD